MEAFAIYLIKSSVWLTGFLLIYMLFLRNERFFVLNRIYLVSGILGSIIFPFFTWHYTVIFPVTPAADVMEPQLIGPITDNESYPIQNLILYFYLTGTLFLFLRLIIQALSIWKVILRTEITHFNSVKLIRSDRYSVSFSFFSFVFVNPSIDELETREIVIHEKEHIRQQHWMDLLLFEIFRTMQWFNPLSWLYGQQIRQNHEYLADEWALQRSSNPAVYRAALLNQMFGGSVISLANSFNYSINKKRFNMMKKKTYSPIRKLKLLLVLPLIAGVFYAFATPEYMFVQVEQESVSTEATPKSGNLLDENLNSLLAQSVDNQINSVVAELSSENKLKVKEDVPQSQTSSTVVQVTSVKSDTVANNLSSDQTSEISTSSSLKSDNSQVKVDKPYVIIDGVAALDQNANNIPPETIESIDVIKGITATNLYGEKGKNGVILITTKKIASDTQTSPSEVKVVGYGTMQNANPEIQIRSNGKAGTESKPLIVIDGKISEYQDLDEIDSDTVESVSVLKNELAINKYGEKAKNGVLEITLKKDKQSGESNGVILVP